MPSLHFTAALNKSEPPSFTSQRNDDHTLKITAALGGSRREANTASIQSGGVCTAKKSPTPKQGSKYKTLHQNTLDGVWLIVEQPDAFYCSLCVPVGCRSPPFVCPPMQTNIRKENRLMAEKDWAAILKERGSYHCKF